MADTLHAVGRLVRMAALTCAMTATARIARLPLLALAVTRRIAPADMRHLCDRQAQDADLIALYGRACALHREADALARQAPSGQPFEDGERFERETVLPLDRALWALEEQADRLTARTIHGHRAQARWLVENKRVGQDDEAWPLVRDLVGEA